MANVATIGSKDGAPVYAATLTSDAGVAVAILSWGCVVQSWRVPDRTGVPREVTLGFPDFAPYPEHSRSFGIVAGRLANRVRDGRFTLAGTTYQLDRNRGPHHLHGGSQGLGRQNFALEADATSVRLTHTSPDGHMGYPGSVRFTVDIALSGTALTFSMTGVPDRPTPVSLAQHSYYALGGPVADHRLTVAASRVTEIDDLVVPTGRILPVAGTAFDFRTPRAIGGTRLDLNFCLDAGTPAVILEGSDFRLALATDRPGLQVYDAYDLPPVPVPGHGGVLYGPWCAVALEAQDWPDAVNHEGFPSIIATPERPYRQTTSIAIAPL